VRTTWVVARTTTCSLGNGNVDRVARVRDSRFQDATIAVALAALLVLQLLLSDRGGSVLVNTAGALLLTLPLAARRRAPLAVAGTYVAASLLSAALGGGLHEGEPPPFASLAAGAIAFYSVGAYLEDRPALLGAGIGFAGLWSSVIVNGEIDLPSFLFSGGLIVATPWFAGRSARSRAQRAAMLAREQRQREQVAVVEERARIARELHDVVAHHVGAIVAQSQGAQRLIDRDPERTREALATIEATGRAALGEMRASLGVLRKPQGAAPLAPQSGMEDLTRLVEQARRSGLAVELVTEGKPAPLPAGADLSVYRIVQEALTNTLKHAGPVSARVAVRYGDGELELEISDEGAPGRAAGRRVEPGGHGLVGMRERVALYGGDLRAGHRPEGGFVVRASLPLAP
jgi:signal transduction histidine kinase